MKRGGIRILSTALMTALASALPVGGCDRSEAPPGGGGDGAVVSDGGVLLGDGGGPACSGRALTQSGALDLPITSVRVSGKVTLGGQPLPLPPGATGRGVVVFTETRTFSTFAIALGAAGPAAYDAWLAPGVYDVTWRGDAAWCAQGPSPLPCNGGVVARAVALAASGALDLDVPPPVQVTGAVTLDGTPLPGAAGGRGAIGFGDFSTPSLGTAGAATYHASLLPGTYDVRYLTAAARCDAAPLPCIDGILKPAVALTASGVLDLDIPTVQVSGTVTLLGAPLPAAADRGSIGFTRGTDYSRRAGLGASGAGQYRATLLPGVYDVGYGAPGTCAGSPFPCSSGVVKAQVALDASGVLDLDVPAIQVTGAVTLNGGPLPSGADRGGLSFGAADVSLGTSGAGQYRVTLFPGNYDIGYRANPNCPNGLPCNRGPLKSKVALTASGVLDIDIPAIQVSGAVTLNGGALPDRAADRGALWFQLTDGESASTAQTLGASGPGRYQTTLLPGQYSVLYAASATCDATLIPCTGGTLKSGLALQASGVLDIDIPAIQISGAVTFNGGALPQPPGPGALWFSGGTLPLAPTYRIALIPGDYVIRYQSTPTSCEPAPGPGLPCDGQIIFGCP